MTISRLDVGGTGASEFGAALMKTYDQAAFAQPLGNGLYSAVVFSNGCILPVPGYECTTQEMALHAAQKYLSYVLEAYDFGQADEGQATTPTEPVEPSPFPGPIVPEIPAPNVPQPQQPPPIDPIFPEPID